MRQNPPTCQKSREEVLMENSFRTTEHFDDGDDDHFPASSHKVIAMVIEFFQNCKFIFIWVIFAMCPLCTHFLSTYMVWENVLDNDVNIVMTKDRRIKSR